MVVSGIPTDPKGFLKTLGITTGISIVTYNGNRRGNTINYRYKSGIVDNRRLCNIAIQSVFARSFFGRNPDPYGTIRAELKTSILSDLIQNLGDSSIKDTISTAIQKAQELQTNSLVGKLEILSTSLRAGRFNLHFNYLGFHQTSKIFLASLKENMLIKAREGDILGAADLRVGEVSWINDAMRPEKILSLIPLHIFMADPAADDVARAHSKDPSAFVRAFRDLGFTLANCSGRTRSNNSARAWVRTEE